MNAAPKAINGYKGWAALIITAILSGSGGSIVTPMVVPDLYRKYPFTSLDAGDMEQRIRTRLNGHAQVLEQTEAKMEELEERLEKMTVTLDNFAEFGPTAVRESLSKITELIQDYHAEAVKERADMKRQQELHFERSHPRQPWR